MAEGVSILSVRNVSTGYGGRQILFDISLDLRRQETLLIVGENGSGKSTLLKAMYGILPAWNAEAKIEFWPEPDSPALEPAPPVSNLRKGIAYLPQRQSVFDDLTALENLRVAGESLRPGHLFTERFESVLDTFPALRPALRREAGRMSGGERQMLGLAMVLLHRPRLLLMDEPTAGLSTHHTGWFIEQLERIRLAHALTLVVVEHRIRELLASTQRIVGLRGGTIVLDLPSSGEASPEDLRIVFE
jgi:branched-chain amino acid transport system ATP-binding protein